MKLDIILYCIVEILTLMKRTEYHFYLHGNFGSIV